MKKYSRIIIYVCGTVAALTFGFLMAIGVSNFDFSSIKVNAKSLPRIFVISSGSMEPTIKTGGIIVVRPAEYYKQNDIVTFSYDLGGDNLITHRIEFRGVESDGSFYYQTSGDANSSFDSKLITDSNIVGKVVYTLPYLGYFADFAKKPQGFILLIVVPATIIIYEELKKLWNEVWKRTRHVIKRPNFVSGRDKDNRGLSKVAMAIPFFGASLLFISVSSSFFSDSETSVLNSFTANVPTPTQAPISSPVADHVVISEVQINGANANQDFVELYNPTNIAVDLSGWQIQKKTSTGTISSLVLIPNGKSIPAYGYFLWANTQTPQSPFSTSVGADVSNGNNIGENNSIALEDDSDVIIDQVGWGTGTSQYFEAVLINNGSSLNKSMERKAYDISTQATMEGGIHSTKGNGWDSNNNATDFILRTVSQPQNSLSPIEMP